MNERLSLLMVPGYNEPSEHLELLADGTGEIAGLRASGVACTIFPQREETLDERVERFARSVEEVLAREPFARLTMLGYSLGGLVIRGFLRAYPRLAERVDGVVTVATPHTGVRAPSLAHVARALCVPDRTLEDVAVGSAFLQRLNGMQGEPWIAPAHVRALAIAGTVPRYGDNDGLVWGDSATFESRIPAHFLIGPTCNHLNLIGHFDAAMLLAKGFVRNDRVWPLTLRAILRFCGANP